MITLYEKMRKSDIRRLMQNDIAETSVSHSLKEES